MVLHQILQSTFLVNSDWFSFDLSVSHLGVLLHSETEVLVLPRFQRWVGRWRGRDHFAKLQLILPLLGICIGSWMLRDWLVAFLRDVFLIVHRLVSVAVLRFTLPAVGYVFVLPAVGHALSVLFIIAPDLRFSSRAVFVPSLLYFIFPVSDSLSPLALWLWFRLCFFSRVTLW